MGRIREKFSHRTTQPLTEENMHEHESNNNHESLKNDESFVLHHLHTWLIQRGISAARASFTTESIDAFAEQRLMRMFRPDDHALVGIAAAPSEIQGQDVFLELLWPTWFDVRSPAEAQQMIDLNSAFVHGVALPLLPNPALHLDLVTAKVMPDDPRSALEEYCAENGREFFGVLMTKPLRHQTVFSAK